MSFLKSSLVRRCEGGSGARKSWSPGIFRTKMTSPTATTLPRSNYPTFDFSKATTTIADFSGGTNSGMKYVSWRLMEEFYNQNKI